MRLSRTSVATATVCFALLCSSPAPAQSTTEAPAETRNEVLVFGDVAKSGVFSVATLPTVTEFVDRADGLSKGGANVRVVRNGTVAWGALCEPDTPCDFKVRHGDILVVHSLERLSGQRAADGSQPRIMVTVINPTKRPLFVNIPAGEGRASQVLEKVGMQNQSHRIIRTHPKAPAIVKDKDPVLQHGDILMVDEPTRTTSLRVTPASATTTSESTTPVPEPYPAQALPEPLLPQDNQVPADAEPVPAVADYGDLDQLDAAAEGTSEAGPALAPPPADVLPEITPANTLPVSPVTDTAVRPIGSLDEPSLDVDPWELDGSSQSSGAMRPGSQAGFQDNGDIPPFEPNAAAIPVPSNNGATINTTPPAAPLNYGTLGRDRVDLAATQAETAATPTESSAELPLPGELEAAVDAESGGILWYVVGLGGALILVLGAWVYGSRALADSPQMQHPDQYKRPISRSHSQTVKQAPVVPDEAPVSAPEATHNFQAASMEKPAAPVIKPIAAPVGAAQQTPAPAVQPQAPAPQPAPVSVPAVAQHAAPVSTLQQPAAPTVSAAVVPGRPVQMPVPPTPETQVAMAAPAAPVGASEEIAEPPASPAPEQEQPARSEPVAAVEPTAEPIPVPDTSTTRILDALIRNDLPISEQPVQLPTKLEFYGDSNGPKRLRIDPAQPVLKGPHTALRSGLQRKEQSASAESFGD